MASTKPVCECAARLRGARVLTAKHCDAPRGVFTVFSAANSARLLGVCVCAVMIHPQVHLRIPCYDFYFLYSGQFAHLLGAPRAGPKTRLRDQSEELINWSDR